MPAAETVLSWATGVANDWRWLATAWHVALAALLVAVSRSRLSRRRLGFLLALPIASVALVATLSGNPFNALTFALFAILLLRSVTYLPATPAALGSGRLQLAGWLLIAVGWVYPHFLVTDTWTAYAYASPFGLLPCPTLSVVIGVTLAVGGLRPGHWDGVLAAAGVMYGGIGVFGLGVALDVWLLAGALLLAAAVVADVFIRPVRASTRERTRRLSGDELIPSAIATLTHAITLSGPPAAVWPWLVQMGAGSRAGWYSYDFLDNGRQPSARRIVPELQQIAVGELFPAGPGVSEGFIVLAFEPRRSLILGWPNRDGSPIVSWAFVLEPRAVDATRLIVRVRAGQNYRFHRLPRWLSNPAIRLVHFLMERKQLLGIARRLDQDAPTRRYRP